MEFRTKELYGDFYENGDKPLLIVIGGSIAGIPIISEDLMNYFKSNYMFPKSSWTIGGRDIPFVKFRYDGKIINDIRKHEYLSCSEKSIQLNKNKNAMIKVNNFKGNLLLLSAETNHYWPSKQMCKLMEENSAHNIKHVALNPEEHYFLQYQESSKEIIAYLSQHQ